MGDDLPIAMYGHSIIAISSSFGLLVQGEFDGGTYFVNISNDNSVVWSTGPNLKVARSNFGSALFFDSKTNTKYIMVAGGVQVSAGNGCHTYVPARSSLNPFFKTG